MNSHTMDAHHQRIARKTLSMIRIATALIFVVAGAAKLGGAEQLVLVFDQIGWGQWLRYFTGAVELTGATLMLLPLTATIGGALLSAIMVGAVFAQALAVEGSAVPALVLLLLASTLAWIYWPRSVLHYS